MKVNGEIVFGATAAATKEIIEQSNGDAFKYKKDHIARDLGMKIADEKGWVERGEGDMVVAEIRLYVFTPAELIDFCDAKFKAKLQKMAATEKYLTDDQREVLMIQSERF